MASKSILEEQSAAQPFLKWVGGKGRLLPQLSELYPKSYNDYFEPFVGGGAVFFSINPKVAHINDTNQVLMAAYKHIRGNVQKVIKHLSVLELKFHGLETIKEKSAFYYEKREQYNNLPATSFEKTILLIFLNKTCFNGVYRENSKGGFNVPYGKHLKPTICSPNNLTAVSRALQHTTITSSSFEVAVKKASADDFIYFDPPYHPLNATSSFTSYQASGFNTEDQEKLRDLYSKLAKRGCKVMLSNSDTDYIRGLYEGFNIHTVYAGRAINSVGGKRGKISEVVITNY